MLCGVSTVAFSAMCTATRARCPSHTTSRTSGALRRDWHTYVRCCTSAQRRPSIVGPHSKRRLRGRWWSAVWSSQADLLQHPPVPSWWSRSWILRTRFPRGWVQMVLCVCAAPMCPSQRAQWRSFRSRTSSLVSRVLTRPDCGTSALLRVYLLLFCLPPLVTLVVIWLPLPPHASMDVTRPWQTVGWELVGSAPHRRPFHSHTQRRAIVVLAATPSADVGGTGGALLACMYQQCNLEVLSFEYVASRAV